MDEEIKTEPRILKLIFREKNMSKQIQSKQRQRGQGMTEYLIIGTLIAMVSIGVVGSLGNGVKNQIAGMAQEVGGTDAAAQTQAATAAGAAAANDAANQDNLSNWQQSGASIGQ